MNVAKKIISSVLRPSSQTASESQVPDEGTPFPTVKCSLAAELVGHEERVWSVAWHPTEPLLASASGDKTVRIWGPHIQNPTQWVQLAVLEGEHQRTVRHVSWSPSGSLLAAASFDGTVSLWRRDEGTSAGQEDDEQEVRGVLSMTHVGVLEGHENEVKCCAWIPDDCLDKHLATCSRDRTVWVWERAQGDQQEEEDEDEYVEFECGGVLSGHSQDVKAVRWLSSNGRSSLLSCSYDGTMKLWEETPGRRDDWHCVQTLHHGALGTVWDVAVQPLPDSLVHSNVAPVLAAATEAGTLRFWRQSTRRAGVWITATDCLISQSLPLYTVDWLPEGASLLSSMVVASCGDNGVAFCGLRQVEGWQSVEEDLHTMSATVLHRVPQAHDGDVNCARIAPLAASQRVLRSSGAAEGSKALLMATCGDDLLVKVWQVVLA